MEYKENIEELFKNSFENFETDVHPEAWINIQNGLNLQPAAPAATAGAKVASVASKFNVLFIVGAVALSGIIVASLFYFSSEDTKTITPVQHEVAVFNEPVAPTIKNVTNIIQRTAAEQKTLPVSAEKVLEKIIQEKPAPQKQPEIYASSADITIAPPIIIQQSIKEEKTTVPQVIKEENKITAAKEENVNIGNENKKEADESPDKAESDFDANEAENKEAPGMPNAKSTAFYLGQIPDVITPNQDGKNDIFIINGNELLSLMVSIFDHSGKMIHQWNNLHGFWDGQLTNGKKADAGVYFYDIYAINAVEQPVIKKGSFQLLIK